MDKRQKQILIVGGGAAVVFLAYRAYTNSGSVASNGQSANPDTSASDYASLAGQEQSDAAGLQSQNQELYTMLLQAEGQEQADVANQNQFNADASTALSALANTITGFGDALGTLTSQQAATAGLITDVQNRLNQTAMGITPPSKAPAAAGHTLTKGLTQKQAGQHLTAVQRPTTHHPAVAHPNATHQPARTHAKKTTVNGKVILSG